MALAKALGSKENELESALASVSALPESWEEMACESWVPAVCVAAAIWPCS